MADLPLIKQQNQQKSRGRPFVERQSGNPGEIARIQPTREIHLISA
jgi:hypothetical protein